jgi:hypothetical protein
LPLGRERKIPISGARKAVPMYLLARIFRCRFDFTFHDTGMAEGERDSSDCE